MWGALQGALGAESVLAVPQAAAAQALPRVLQEQGSQASNSKLYFKT